MTDKIKRLQYLSRRIAEMQVEFMDIKKSMHESNEHITVYEVRPSVIRTHVRRGFTARRIKR